MSLLVPLRWPSLLPSITATTSERWKGWREWYFKYSIIAGFEDCASLREKPQRPRLCFLCVSPRKKKQGWDAIFPFPLMCADGGNQGFLSALWAHTSSYPFAVWWLSVRTSNVLLIALMKMCHSRVSHAGHGASLPAGRQGDATGRHCVVL